MKFIVNIEDSNGAIVAFTGKLTAEQMTDFMRTLILTQGFYYWVQQILE